MHNEIWMDYNRAADDAPDLEPDQADYQTAMEEGDKDMYKDLREQRNEYYAEMQNSNKGADPQEEEDFYTQMSNTKWIPGMTVVPDFPESAHDKFEKLNNNWSEREVKEDIYGYGGAFFAQSGEDYSPEEVQEMLAESYEEDDRHTLGYVHRILHTVEEVEKMLEDGHDSLDPKHYNELPEALQHWNVVPVMGWDYYIGNATKYLWRAGKKSSGFMSDHDKEVEDLRKAVIYINKRIDYLKGK